MSKGAVVGAVLMAALMLGSLIVISAQAQAAEVWESMDDMPFQTDAFSTAQLPDGRVFFNGGTKEGTNGLSDETWLYDPGTDTWDERAPSPVATYLSSAVYMPDGRVYVFCGRDTHNHWDHGVMVYDIADDIWKQLTGDPDLGYFREVVALDPKRILIAGGFVVNVLIPVPSCMIYDIAFNTFSDAEPLPYAVGFGSMVKAENSVYYLGGVDPFEAIFYENILRYEISTGQWSQQAKMSEPRYMDSEALGGDGLVYLYGQAFSAEFVPSFRAVDLRDGSFRDCPGAPSKGRTGGIASTSDGRVMIFGGEYEDVVSQEVYSLTLFEKDAWLGNNEAGPGETVRVYVSVDAVAAGPEGMTANAYLLRDGISYGRYELIGVGNGTASALMTLPDDLGAGEYEVRITDVDLGVGIVGMLEFESLSLTVTNAPSPTDRIGELQDQLNDTQQELAEVQGALDELKEATDAKMDAMIGYVILILALASLVVGVVVLVRKK